VNGPIPLDLANMSWLFVEGHVVDSEAAAHPEIFGDFTVSYGNEALQYHELIEASGDVVTNFPGVRSVTRGDSEQFLVWGEVDLVALRATLEQWWCERAARESDEEPSTKDPSETARRTFRRMLREQIDPALREMGFDGSAGIYSLTNGECRAELAIEANRHSTRELVSFYVTFVVKYVPNEESPLVGLARSLGMTPDEVLEMPDTEYIAAKNAYQLGMPPLVRAQQQFTNLGDLLNPGPTDLVQRTQASREQARAPGWWELPPGSPIKPRSGIWELPAGGPIEPLARLLIDGMKDVGLPTIHRQCEQMAAEASRPAGAPTRLGAEDALGGSQPSPRTG
jgi:hypothetical protein